MAETWDLSLLIDLSTRIFDARGMTGRHLGLEARFLPDRLFIDFVDPLNRGAFRRRLVKMMAGKLDIVRVRVITASEGCQEFFATLRRATATDQWWLMLAASLRDETPALAALERTGLAAGDEFMMLVESAARQLGGEIDLMQVRAEFLADTAGARSVSDTRRRLEAQFDEIVVEQAYDNIATRPQPGEYLMLKDRGKPADEVLDRLGAAAERLSIPAAELGLQSRSMPMASLAGDFGAERIGHMVFDLRHDPSVTVREWEVEPAPRSWIKPVLRSAATALSGILPARADRRRP